MQRRELLKAGAGGAVALAAPIVRAHAQPVPTSSLSKIKHVVVLMLENRSFDSMLGMLYPKSDRFDGLDGTESNPDLDGRPIRVNNKAGHSAAALTRPTPKPGEKFRDVTEQLFGNPDPPAPGQVPAMNGFVRNYLLQAGKPAAEYDPAQIMHYFTPPAARAKRSGARLHGQ